MKVQILSMQRIVNYGSFLQAYALKNIVEELGHKVDFLDIKKGEYIEYKEYTSTSTLEKIINIIRHLFSHKILFKLKNKINSKIIINSQKKYLNLKNELRFDSEGYDATIIGSDEVFNCATTSSWGVSSQLFGNIDTPVVFSYAGSCGYTMSSDVPTQCLGYLNKAVNKMQSISVRDTNTYNFFFNLFDKKAVYNFDPVLIYDFNNDENFKVNYKKINKKYMIIYAYHERINGENEINAIKNYAKKHNLKIYCVGGMLSWCDKLLTLNPFEVLNVFKNAECIVTDTFHGTIMATKFKKRFVTIIRNNNRNKLEDLLIRLNLKSQLLENCSELENKLDFKIDYDSYDLLINKEREKSLQYLRENLKVKNNGR